jgi:hypothetical protein
LEKYQLLKDARNDIYSWATNDLTCQLAKEVMSIGLAKIKLFFKELGADPNHVIVVFGPDGSVTRNTIRFTNGVGYGCVIATKDYIFPSLLRPNGCGYGLYAVEEEIPLKKVIQQLNLLEKKGVPVGNRKGIIDIAKSNHFIDILRLDKIYPEYSHYETWLNADSYVLIHSAQQIEIDRLCYWDQDEFTNIETPFGTIQGLSDESRQYYFDFFHEMELYGEEKRNSIAETLFGEDNVTCISNAVHQGYFAEDKYGVMRLGLYNSMKETGIRKIPIFPLGFNANSFVYLYEGQSNIKERHWTKNQTDRAKQHNHTEFLKKINLLPHGGGYALNYQYSKVNTEIINNNLYFRMQDAPMEGSMLIQDVEALEYKYRGPGEILSLVDRLELGKRIARFFPVHILKF